MTAHTNGHPRRPARLVLEDGMVFDGLSVGAVGEAIGEMVFHTGMTGYQEILTDPSYLGQSVVMTYPLIGNTGTNPEDEESRGTWLSAFVVREMCHQPSNHRSTESLPDYLDRHGVVGIEGIDTRALTLRIREGGAVKGIVASGDEMDTDTLVDMAHAHPDLTGRDLATEVTAPEAYHWDKPLLPGFAPAHFETRESSADGPLVVAVDYGTKRNILRALVSSGFRVRVVPATATADEILALGPAGVFLSNGPGDPAAVEGAAETVGSLLGRAPVFGICLGHQILGRALGADTWKMKFGHHGANQPVKDLDTGAVAITSQNHSFAVDPDALQDGARVTHVNLNDKTVEGIATEGAFSVQYHPEAAPGPNDAMDLFTRFAERIAAATT